MNALSDLSRYDAYAGDTETTGVKYTDRAVGISVHLPDGDTHYIRWGHEAGGNNCTRREAVAWARRELINKESRWFNAPFDLRMLSYDDIWLFRDCSDTANLHDSGIMAPLHNELEDNFKLGTLGEKYLGMPKQDSRALDAWCAEQFGGKPTHKAQIENYWRAPGDMVEPYACEDATITWNLHDHYRPLITAEGLDGLYDLERSLIPMLLKMHHRGVRVDVTAAEELQEDILQQIAEAEHEWLTVHAIGSGDDRFIDSWQRIMPVFERYGLPIHRLAPTERMKLAGLSGNPTFAKDVLAQYDHPVAEVIRNMRRLNHYSGTFLRNYIIGNADDNGFVHGEFHSVRNDRYGTVSGRFSSGGELNLQNVPSRDPVWAPLIRGLFIPMEGMRWAKIDYSQIEYRFFAHYCGGRLEKMYVDNPETDFHQMMADLTGHKRSDAKHMNFAALYGAGVKKLSVMMGCDLDRAKEVLIGYHELAPEVKGLSHKAQNRASSRGFIKSWGGRHHRFPKTNNRYAQVYKALNRLCQGSAADLIKYAMREIDSVIDWEHVVCHLTVHDELDFSVSPCAKGMKMIRQVRETMEDVNNMGAPLSINVPILADAEIGEDWGHCHEDIPRAA